MFFEKKIGIRFTKKQLEDIENLISLDGGESWDSVSHFIRCATLKELRRNQDLKK